MELAVLLHDWGQRINLTGHGTPEAILRGLILDALALERVLPPLVSLVDLGAGAGFPGLPLAVARPHCRFVLVEARAKRHHFQRAAVRALGLDHVEPRLGRIEGLEPERFAGVIAQALAAPERALEWMRPWCLEGGWLLLPGGPALRDLAQPGWLERAETLPYAAALGRPEHHLWRARLSDAGPPVAAK
ncbi:MAG: class I SAM-dependent methyltransferase [Proteobacteria bacterium]|nr:class I SAM-dependent methyltransferase [Pseudomonadota bacterium]